MDDMNSPLVSRQYYSAPIEKVWEAISSKQGMKAWYFGQLEKFEPIVGFEFQFNSDGSPYQKAWTVTRVEKGRLLAHSWNYRGYPGSSEVIFELSPHGEGIMLRVTHLGISSFPSDPHFARERFVQGWKNILELQLKNYLASKVWPR